MRTGRWKMEDSRWEIEVEFFVRNRKNFFGK